MKDFKVRYRNMSLGVLWSLLNPLVMMLVLTFVFSRVFLNPSIQIFPIFILCGLVPFNFFSMAWASATTSLVDNSGLVKRVAVPKQIIPIASVLSNAIHLSLQCVLLLALVIIFGTGVNINWLWLPIVFVLEILFVIGIGMMFSAMDVYVRDMRYAVESFSTVLFWLVPIFYPFSFIPQAYARFFQLNPITAVVLAVRSILLEGRAPAIVLLYDLVVASAITLVLGLLLFDRLKGRFYDHL